MSTPEGYMNVDQMAQEAGVTDRAIYAAIRRGRLVAEKFRRDWFATRKNFEAYQKHSKGKVGRPAKS